MRFLRTLLLVGSILTCNTSFPLEQAKKDQVIKTLSPLLAEVDWFSSRSKPAQSVKDLQTQIKKMLKSLNVESAYRKANEDLNKAAVVSVETPVGQPANFSEVIPGIYRSGMPTLQIAEGLITAGTVDYILALNAELKLFATADPGGTLPLTPERKEKIEKAIKGHGKSSVEVEDYLGFYEQNLEYAQAMGSGKFTSGTLIPLRGPDDSLEEYFRALRKIAELRKKNKKVLFHCSVGKHRTGLIAALIRTLDAGGKVPLESVDSLLLEYVEHNWNQKADTRTQFLIPYALIIRSAPFQKLTKEWKKADRA